MAQTIKELDITAKGEAIMLMMAVTRFMVKRSETLPKSGSGKWKHDATNCRSCMEVLSAGIASSAVVMWHLEFIPMNLKGEEKLSLKRSILV